MQLNEDEKKVLTLLDESKQSDTITWVQKHLTLSVTEIEMIIKKLTRYQLIEKQALADEADMWYFHTKKVTKDMLDDALTYKIRYGCDKPITYATQKLEKKL